MTAAAISSSAASSADPGSDVRRDPGASLRRSGLRRALIRVPIVLLVSFAWGGLTSFGQTYLPSSLSSLANSSSAWLIVVFGLLVAARLPGAVSAVTAVLSFAIMNEGYGVISTARGFDYFAGPLNRWTIIAVVVGPFVGIAAVWLRSERPVRRALAIAVPTLVLLGEAAYALIIVPEASGPWFAAVQIIVTAAWLGWFAFRRIGRGSARTVALVLPVVGAILFVFAYTAAPLLFMEL